MPKSNNQKLKILYLMDALKEGSAKGTTVSMQEILKMLESHSISAERKSIYDDMEALRLYGLDVRYQRANPSGYYLAGLWEEEPKETKDGGDESVVPEAQGSTEPDKGRREDWKKVKLLCKKDKKDQVMEYFRNQAECRQKENGSFLITGKTCVDDQFYGWLASMGTRVKLLKPGKEAASYRDYLKAIVKEYKNAGQKG